MASSSEVPIVQNRAPSHFGPPRRRSTATFPVVANESQHLYPHAEVSTRDRLSPRDQPLPTPPPYPYAFPWAQQPLLLPEYPQGYLSPGSAHPWYQAITHPHVINSRDRVLRRRSPVSYKRTSYTYSSSSASSTDIESDDSDDDDNDDGTAVDMMVFSFKPTRAPSPSSADDNDDDDKTNTSAIARESRPLPAKGDDKTLEVSWSRYSGDAFFEGTHSATLTIRHGLPPPSLPSPTTKSQPQFRWTHLAQSSLDLAKLSAEVMSSPDLSRAEQHALSKLFAQIRRGPATTCRAADGKNANHMTARPIRVAIAADKPSIASASGGKKGFASAAAERRHITWVCVPYFEVQRYSGHLVVGGGGTDASLFPTKTLLQSRYGRTLEDREKKQVVYEAGEGGKDAKCLHIAQLWCIVIENKMLVTCGNMPRSYFTRDLVSIAQQPPPTQLKQDNMIHISYYKTSWSFRVEDCSTWFHLNRKFLAFWPRPLQFSYKAQVVTESDWARIVNTARHSEVAVVLDMRAGIYPQTRPSGVLQPLKRENTRPGAFHVFTWPRHATVASLIDETGPTSLLERLGEIDEHLSTSTINIERATYKRQELSSAQAVYTYLESKTHELEDVKDEELRYALSNSVHVLNRAVRCFHFFFPDDVPHNLPVVGKYWGAILRSIELAVSASTKSDDNEPDRRPGRRGRKPRTPSQGTLRPLNEWLGQLSRVMQYYRTILDSVPDTAHDFRSAPDDLVYLWMHMLMGLVLAPTGGSSSSRLWQEHFERSEVLLRNGTSQLISELATVDLLEHTAVRPQELASLICLSLCRDSVDGQPRLTDRYAEYIKELESKIAETPDRSHQTTVTHLREEMSIVLDTLHDQAGVIACLDLQSAVSTRYTQGEAEIQRFEFLTSRANRQKSTPRYEQSRSQQQPTSFPMVYKRITSSRSRNRAYSGSALRPSRPRHPSRTRSYANPYATGYGYDDEPDSEISYDTNRNPTEYNKLSAADPDGLIGLFLGDARAWVTGRKKEILEMQSFINDLEAENSNLITISKDRQEQAIYAFTMVTIVFLPLGTISSIFGMNTSDIASLEAGQWLYWAVAVPVTLSVIVLGLWWMGELGTLVGWVFGRDSGFGLGLRRKQLYYSARPPGYVEVDSRW